MTTKARSRATSRARRMSRFVASWWRREAAWWQFWRPQSGILGGLLLSALIALILLAALGFAATDPNLCVSTTSPPTWGPCVADPNLMWTDPSLTWSTSGNLLVVSASSGKRASDLCWISPAGAFRRGAAYRGASCSHYYRAIWHQTRHWQQSLAWICWAADPCGAEPDVR